MLTFNAVKNMKDKCHVFRHLKLGYRFKVISEYIRMIRLMGFTENMCDKIILKPKRYRKHSIEKAF